jgi:hypothetical protein
MSDIAIQEELNGKAVDWLELVTDEQYRGTPVDECKSMREDVRVENVRTCRVPI